MYLVAVGFGVGPDGLTLATIRDSGPYGFGLTAPLRLSSLVRARDLTGPPEPAQINIDRLHPVPDQFFRTTGLGTVTCDLPISSVKLHIIPP